jgi:PAS domain S-box-containing protein
MNDSDEARRRLNQELTRLRGQVAELQAASDQRDRVERELRESERRLATLLSNLPGMAYRCRNDEQWTMEFVSEGCFALTGYQRDDLVGNCVVSYNNCILPEDRELVRKRIDQALAEDRHFQIEYRIRTQCGTEKWVWEQGVAVPGPGDRDQVIEGFIADITERKRAVQALEVLNDELEQRVAQRTAELTIANQQLNREVEVRRRAEQDAAVFKQFVEASGQGFGMADLQGYVTYVNPALCRMLGEDDPADVIGQHFSIYSPPEELQRADEEVMPAVMDHDEWSGESSILTRQGRRLSTLESVFLIHDERGAPLRLALAVVDLTERKETLDALQKERHTLWHLLQASDHERQLIAYEIHDGLAQYLAAANMQFQTYLLLRETDPAQAQKAYEAAAQLVSQSHFEARRLISGVRPPVLDEAGVETAIAHLVHDERVFKGLQIEFQSEVQFDRLPAILENALYRIAQESLTNAWKHSHSKRVLVKLVQDGSQIRLAVQDWGIGFDPASVPRGHFGLEGIRERVRLLGGHLDIRTAPRAGTLIQVDVPIVERKADDPDD